MASSGLVITMTSAFGAYLFMPSQTCVRIFAFVPSRSSRLMPGLRAIAAAGTDPKTQQNRTDWTAKLSTYYKFRHEGNDTGMTEFINGALQKPLPPKP